MRLTAEELEVRAAVFARDGLCVLYFEPAAPPCRGERTFHHRRKASAGGAYTEHNGITLCVGHNVWVEDRPDDARAIRADLVVRERDADWSACGEASRSTLTT